MFPLLFPINSTLRNYLIICSILVLTAGILLGMGRVPICACGSINLWNGAVWSAENSQHLTDWYTFSHIIHGFIFYFILWKIFPKMSFSQRLIAATLIEVSWEVLENSNFIINRYRETTIALDYFGDSVVNSLMDCFSCIFGFWLASKLPVKVSIISIIVMEMVVGYLIRDNLTLNVIMLFYSFDSIKAWQMSLKP